MDIVYQKFRKMFDKIFHDILVVKMKKCEVVLSHLDGFIDSEDLTLWLKWLFENISMSLKKNVSVTIAQSSLFRPQGRF